MLSILSRSRLILTASKQGSFIQRSQVCILNTIGQSSISKAGTSCWKRQIFARFSNQAKYDSVPTRSRDYKLAFIGVLSSLGIVALCYNNFTMSLSENPIERALLWPDHIRRRLQNTYFHLGMTFGISSLVLFMAVRSAKFMCVVARSSVPFTFASYLALTTSFIYLKRQPYHSDLNIKHLFWIGHCCSLGLTLTSAAAILGVPIVATSVYAFWMVEALVLAACCSPSESCLMKSGPIAIALGASCASAFNATVMPLGTRIGTGRLGIGLYGCLLAFASLLILSIEPIVEEAEHHPVYSRLPYDPIRAATNIYMDKLNFVSKLLSLLSDNPKSA